MQLKTPFSPNKTRVVHLKAQAAQKIDRLDYFILI